MDTKYIEKLINSCSNHNEYVKSLIDYCITHSKNYKILETKFMNEINREYDCIINVLLKIINPQIIVKIIESNEEKIFEYILKFNNLITTELFLDVLITYCNDDYLNLIMKKKYTYKPKYENFIEHWSFLNIITYHRNKYGFDKCRINREYIVKMILKTKNIDYNLEINGTNYIYLILIYDYKDEYFNSIINHLINLTENKCFYELAKIKIYCENIETKLNLFECILANIIDDHKYEKCLKLTKYVVNQLGENYLNFVLNECDLNLIVINSLRSYYKNEQNVIFNLIWKDDFFEHIEPIKSMKVSYYISNILFEALCNENFEFIEKILLNQVTDKIDFNFRYKHTPFSSSDYYTFFSLIFKYLEHYSDNGFIIIQNKLKNILMLCIEKFKDKINYNYTFKQSLIKYNCDEIYKIDKNFVEENLDLLNDHLINSNDLKQINKLKLKQNINSVENFLNDYFMNACKTNNLDMVKYLIDEYFKFNSIDDITEFNKIIESFEFACEKNYIEIVNLIENKFIANVLDFLVKLKYDNFTQIDNVELISNKELNQKKNKKTKKNVKLPEKKKYYLDKIVNYCGNNKNFELVERLFNYQYMTYKFNYFTYIVDDKTFLWTLIKYDYPNEFIFNVIDKMNLSCIPTHLNTKTQHTALTLSSVKNNIKLFDKLISKFKDNVHPNLNK